MPAKITTSTTLALLTLVAAVAVSYKMSKSSSSSSSSKSTSPSPLNSAFVFVKPHANTELTQNLVRTKLQDANITILSEKDIDGPTIDAKKLIDQHYYAIASKATILPASEIPVPAAKFEEEFGETWEIVLKENRAANAMDACERFGIDATELDAAWGKAEKVVKFGGGFYCGLVKVEGKDPLYVFNAFFMSMRSKFVGAGTSIHCFEIEWDSTSLSWSDFRNKLLGPTDPAEAPATSIRRTILETYKELGLASIPNKGDNGVHASASPFEGLAEKSNWLGADITEDAFGRALIAAGVSAETIKEWSVDPRVEQPGGAGMGSVFDALEDTDAGECLKLLVELNVLNSGDAV